MEYGRESFLYSYLLAAYLGIVYCLERKENMERISTDHHDIVFYADTPVILAF